MCAKIAKKSHFDIVQVLWPTSLIKFLFNQHKIHLHKEGAVIFGHNFKFKWKWGDNENPTKGDPNLEAAENADNSENDAIGFTSSSSSYWPHDEITPADSATANTAETSLQQLQTIEPIDEENTMGSSQSAGQTKNENAEQDNNMSLSEVAPLSSKRFKTLREMTKRLFS